MILKEGDKVRKTENGIVYGVKKIRDKGLVILRSEDGSTSVMMNTEDIDLYFTLEGPSPVEERSSL